MSPRHIPNLISIARILLVLPVIEAMLTHDFRRAIVWFTIAGLSDGVDGFLARHYGWQSRLGSFLDPVADKLLLGSSFICLAWLGLLPVWLAVLVVLRDLVIFFGALASYFLTEPFDGQPSRISKLNTLGQLILVFAMLLSPDTLPVPARVLQSLVLLVSLTTLASGILYVLTWGSRFYRVSRSPGH